MYTGAESSSLSLEAILLSAAAAVFGISLACNGFFLKAAFRELRELRDRDRTREVQVARVETRVDALERVRPPTSPAPIAARHARA